jgi:hypothetical protein
METQKGTVNSLINYLFGKKIYAIYQPDILLLLLQELRPCGNIHIKKK